MAIEEDGAAFTPIGARLHACKMQGKTTQVAAAVMSVATQSKFRLRIPSAPWGVTITHGLQQKNLAYLPLARADLAPPARYDDVRLGEAGYFLVPC